MELMLMMKNEVKINFSLKQQQAFNVITDKVTNELFYGGAAGGGKSWLGCSWLVYMCVKYAGTRWLMGRAKLKHLKQSTLLSLFMVCKVWGLRVGKDFIYNSQSGVVSFGNGSEIFLKDLFHYPSDPEFDSLGSTEYTGAYIDEASEVSNKAKEIVTSRLRYKLNDYDLIPKILITSNPSKNFIYSEFYKPFKNGTLKSYRKVIIALVQDNPYISPHYIENLKKLDKASKERLFYGNFEYDDDPSRLMEYDKIVDLFTNQFVYDELAEMYLSVDVARFGRDKAVLSVWQGFFVRRMYVYDKSDTVFLKDKIVVLENKFRIPRSNVIIDEDGVGGGLVDVLPGCKGFVGGSRALEVDGEKVYQDSTKYFYKNLRSQCYFKLSELVNNNSIGFYEAIPVDFRESIIEELEQIKRKDIDKDGSLAIIGKDVMKENIGRSPDFADSLMMRAYFCFEKSFNFGFLEG
jgi:phage terminase large subunit